MGLYEHVAFDQHERVVFFSHRESGLRAIIAVHNTVLGAAMGGCRMYPYRSSDEALVDVLRLSRGMTFKSAVAGLPLGGGKSVIIGDPLRDKTPALLRQMGRCIDSLGGIYIGAEDSGINEEDIRLMAEETPWVAGFSAVAGSCGDPSPATAYGVFMAIKTALQFRYQSDDLNGVRVAVQGLGNVGYRLAAYLYKAGASLVVADPVSSRVQQAVREFNATAVSPEEILLQPVEVLSPCAMGAILNARTVPALRATIIAGSANNQLESDAVGVQLLQYNILYAPDYVINSGGIIDVWYQRQLQPPEVARRHMEQVIPQTLLQIFRAAAERGMATNLVADEVALQRLLQPRIIYCAA
ncbi:Glu/Leu/Phe/Val dehydrogenase [Pseudomaricurvus sp. HS19]|uniref:Glu/Leu/Phe/Val family dehydrogenase n=1 Tax=Pseudomaricurvus sp. HS19 TaxID=2692626 RepID=UPI00136F3D6D|nr:Glu/Leu/Phe/Val dehydrogenase [Pseudomaricurvus sp. HS19]MYM63619.1 amino acid dehydrogenase [Pseudomaricurvus sp. HS19]